MKNQPDENHQNIKIPSTFSGLVNEIESQLTDHELRLFGNGAAHLIAERATILSIFAAEHPFDKEAFKACVSYDLSYEQSEALLSLFLNWKLLKEKANETFYEIYSPCLLPYDLNKRVNEEDQEIFDENYEEKIRCGLEKIRELRENDKKFSSEDLINHLAKSFNYIQIERLIEIAQGRMIFKRTRTGGYVVNLETSEALGQLME